MRSLMSLQKRYMSRSSFTCWGGGGGGGGVQCSSWSGPRLLGPQHRPLWHWENEREWTKTVGAMIIPRYVCNKYNLPHQACPQSILETPKMASLAPAGSRHHSKIMLNCLLVTRRCHRPDCDTDHSLVGSKVHLRPKRTHYSKQKGRPRIKIARTSNPDACVLFTNSINEALKDCPKCCVEERWNHIREATYDSAMGSFGKEERQSHDWFEAGIAELEPAIEAKRTALLNYKREPSEKTLAAHRKARNIVQRIARRCSNDYWLNLC